MNIYGCDFSGAKNPEGKIFIASGRLTGNRFTVEQVFSCEDRLDLYYYIRTSRAPWGVDFPFSIPEYYLEQQYASSWDTFIEGAYSDTRDQFKQRFGQIHSGKSSRDLRVTDIAVDGKSPVSSTPIAMHAMVYGALRLLHNLQGDAAVYPFQPYREGVSRLYEIYPGHGWKALKLKSSAPDALQGIPFSFRTQVDSGFEISISPEAEAAAVDARGQASLHARDAVMACIQMAYCLRRYGLESSEQHKPEFASEEEWKLRMLEGLVVRMLP
ncbi:hypothetical protein [Paenibacillus sp. FSL R7-0331]|uniref:hypothetical protein n=1 Tax=Paenibacillus sp. FSL R7-0331 TaxID=1536773 RepID=UPI0004F90AAE|nr:hypothetical protein [Paenibacillus sp. FSL R7-0331]AIQ53528.1 hypothetical protein R70331_19685 [Paenibacillus sp. FSL R7-0331]